MSDRVERMRKARNIPQVTLQKYNQLRSRCPGSTIWALEGFDDVTFYDAINFRIKSIEYVPFVCKGKDKVLDLRLMLSRNTSADRGRVRYFVDSDFDGLKGQSSGEDIYCTPSYSFENLLVSRDVLKPLLRSEYRCVGEFGNSDIERIERVFDERLAEFIDCMRRANHLIYFARVSGVRLKDIQEDLKKYITIRLDCVVTSVEPECLPALVGYECAPQAADLSACESAFAELDPVLYWRGKFIFGFFRKFLAELKEDRGSNFPRYFKERGNVTFSPGNDIVRTLASMIPIPECLKTFLAGSSGSS